MTLTFGAKLDKSLRLRQRRLVEEGGTPILSKSTLMLDYRLQIINLLPHTKRGGGRLWTDYKGIMVELCNLLTCFHFPTC